MKKNTLDNKIVAVIIFIISLISLPVTGEATVFLIFTIIFVIPLWFAKKNYIGWWWEIMNISNEEKIKLIEAAFNLKLHEWQKLYLFDEFEDGYYIPCGRKNGRTFAYMIKLCLSEGDPIKLYRTPDLARYRDENHGCIYDHWFRQELRIVYKTLLRTNLKLRTIYFTELQYRSRTKLMLL